MSDYAAMTRRFVGMQDTGDVSEAGRILAPGFVCHIATYERIDGAAGFKEHVGALRRAFPDVEHRLEELIADGSRVAVRLTVSGTHQGEYGGVQPTGRKVTFSAMGIHHFEGEQMVEAWYEFDGLGFMQQLEGKAAH